MLFFRGPAAELTACGHSATGIRVPMRADDRDKLTWNGTFTMAAGGMVGGGIFSVLGVVVALAGGWAWLSLLLAGAVALLASLSYVALSTRWHQGGGAYGYLRRLGHDRAAVTLAWVLVIGYVLTLSVYAFTFGHYLANVVDLSPPWWPRIFALAILATLVAVNLRGVGDAQRVEVVTVWAKLAVLLALGGIGLVRFNPENLAAGTSGEPGALEVVLGAASVFMAYEGFQLLAYDYDDIADPDRTLPRAVPAAVVVVIVTYVVVALGAASLVGASTLVAEKEIALAAAGLAALGQTGLVIVTVGAVFSTGSAINATLFATARLTGSVARAHRYPSWLRRTNAQGAPVAAVLALGGLAAVLATVGGLTRLVEAASLVFLATFTIVCAIAWRERAGWRTGAGIGAVAAGLSTLALAGRVATQTPWALAALVVAVGLAVLLRRPAIDHEGS